MFAFLAVSRAYYPERRIYFRYDTASLVFGTVLGREPIYRRVVQVVSTQACDCKPTATVTTEDQVSYTDLEPHRSIFNNIASLSPSKCTSHQTLSKIVAESNRD